jgi:hypothetical protein
LALIAPSPLPYESRYYRLARYSEEHHSSIEQRFNFIDDEQKHLDREYEHLYKNLLRLKLHSMKYNLFFEGIPQETDENTETVVKTIGK